MTQKAFSELHNAVRRLLLLRLDCKVDYPATSVEGVKAWNDVISAHDAECDAGPLFTSEDVALLEEWATLADADRDMGEVTEDEAQEAQAISDGNRLRSLASRISSLLPPAQTP